VSKTPKDYWCLTCNAQRGQPCKRPSGYEIPFGDFHAGRKKVWSFFNSPGAGADPRSPEEIEADELRADAGSQEALF
jgi:hypothetical protein